MELKNSLNNCKERLARSFRWFIVTMCVGFLVLFLTATKIFGFLIIGTAAIGSVVLYAAIAATIGYFGKIRPKKEEGGEPCSSAMP